MKPPVLRYWAFAGAVCGAFIFASAPAFAYDLNPVTPLVNNADVSNANPLPTVASTTGADPCANSNVAKSSVAISVAAATTTQLVAISGTKAVYVCGLSMTIAPSATAAATALFEYGTSTNCTGTHALTGTFGAGDLTTAAPVASISQSGGLTLFSAPASNGLCLVTAGTTVSVQGVLTYVQQ